MTDIIGTGARDSLVGTSGNDHLQGLGGDDSLFGQAGDDLMEGGDGSDYIQSFSGSDTADGGAGDDRIDIGNYDSAAATIQAYGGEGNDLVLIDSSGPHTILVDAGAGDDEVTLGLIQNGSTARITLGSGSDSIRVIPFNLQSGFTPDAVTVTDFQTGAAGDRLDWLDFLGAVLIGWDSATNPFATGRLRLFQSGADALLQIDRDGAGSTYAFETLIRFENTLASTFVWQNLDGYPADGSIPSGLVFNGTDGDDRIHGSAGADEINGLGGSNRMWGAAGDDVIHGGDGYDELYGGPGADRLEGGAGYDVLQGGDGDDLMYGGADGDYFHDLDGNDLFDGGDGDDRFDLIRGSLHSDTVTANGGSGNDYFFFASYGASSFIVDGGVGDDLFDVGLLKGPATMTLGAGVDTIRLQGVNADALIFSGSILVPDFTPGAGGDVVDISQFFTGAGGDNPFGNGMLQLVQDGADTLLVSSSRAFMRFSDTQASSFVAENFGGYAPDGSPPPGQTIVGTEDSDTLTGGAGPDDISGLGAADILDGGAGNDTISGGAGDDQLDGGNGNDSIDAGEGNDSVHDQSGSDHILLGEGNDALISNGGSDYIDAGPGNDSLNISRQDGHGGETVTAFAGDGDDLAALFLYSRSTVLLDMGAGNDRVTMYGVTADVTITLGSGADVVDFTGVFGAYTAAYGHISITDFNDAAGDRLDLSSTLAASVAGWDGTTNPFTAGYLRLVQVGADTRLELDDDGPGGADSFFLLAELKNVGAGSLSAANFGFAVPVVYGSGGNDVFVVDEAGDQISDPGGTDEVRTSLAAYVLPTGLENLTGTSSTAQDLRGNALDNILAAGGANDFVRAQDGGNDIVSLGAGNDAVYFGAAYTSADSVDGGSGSDQLALQGNYSAGVTLGTMTGVETLVAMTHSDLRFGGGSASPYSYNIVATDAAVAAGTQLLVNASTLEAGENLTFDGHAETNGSFFIYGGKGVDTLTGGTGADVFFFAEDGRFAATDHIDGGAGDDVMVLRGNYSLTLSGTSIVNVETVVLNSGSDARFYAAGTPFSYDVTTADDTVAAGQTMTFNGGQLAANEILHFDGAAETNGNFRLFGGSANDVIKGGAGNDLIWGGLGADQLTGGGGADIFRYASAAQSSSTHFDTIFGFIWGTDHIDLPFTVGGFADHQAVGQADSATFDADVARLVDGDLNPFGAIELTTVGGDMGNRFFLVVDADGDGAYHANLDYVIELPNVVVPPDPTLFV